MIAAVVAFVQIDVAGRSINVGRPKGWIEAEAAPPPAAIGAAQAFAAQLAAGPSPVLRMDNIVKARMLVDPTEIADVRFISAFAHTSC